MRFDEIELEAVPLMDEPPPIEAAAPAAERAPRTWWRSLLSALTDISLFAALVLALSPLLPQPYEWMHAAALAGFVLVFSYYYFVGAWMLWGKTIGGAIFDVRRPAITLRDASVRWAAGVVGVAVCAGALYASFNPTFVK